MEYENIKCPNCNTELIITTDENNSDVVFCEKCGFIAPYSEFMDKHYELMEKQTMAQQNPKMTETLDFSTVEEYLPTGKYDFEIVKQESGITEPTETNPKKTPFLRIVCKVINNPDYSGENEKCITHTFWKTPKAMGFLQHAMKCMGWDAESLKGKMVLPENFLVGKKFSASVVTEEIFPKITKIYEL